MAGVWCGSVGALASGSVLREAGITHVLSMGGGSAKLQSLQSTGLQVLQVDIRDCATADLLGVWPLCDGFIRSALAKGSGVLVVSMLGKSRSVAIVVAHLITCGMALNDALALVKEKRSGTSPNQGFLAQLSKFASRRASRRRQEPVHDSRAHSSGM